MIDGIPQFGTFDPVANYILRPGGYAVIVGPSGQIALVSIKGGFYLLGGGQGDGESAEAAAIRESLEEVGLRIRILDRIGIVDELVFAADERTHFRKRCTFFRAELLTQEPGIAEVDHKLVWTSIKEAISLLRHESQKWAVAETVG